MTAPSHTPPAGRAEDHRWVPTVDLPRRAGQRRGRTPLLNRDSADLAAWPPTRQRGQHLRATRWATRPAAAKIGRASCRERGEISVVAGSVKKKKEKEDGEWTSREREDGAPQW